MSVVHKRYATFDEFTLAFKEQYRRLTRKGLSEDEQCVHAHDLFAVIHAGVQTRRFRRILRQLDDFDAIFQVKLVRYAESLRRLGLRMRVFYDDYRAIYGPDHTFAGEQ
jgi:hypothetical protein